MLTLITGKVTGDKINWLGDIHELVYLFDNLYEHIEEDCFVNNSIKPLFAHHFLYKNQRILKEQTIYDARRRYADPKSNSNSQNKLKILDSIIQIVEAI